MAARAPSVLGLGTGEPVMPRTPESSWCTRAAMASSGWRVISGSVAPPTKLVKLAIFSGVSGRAAGE